MSDHVDWAVLDRYFGGEATSQEAAAVRQWVAADPARAEEIAAMRRIWEASGVTRRRFDVGAARARMHERMAESARAAVPARAPRFAATGGRMGRWAIAAGLAATVAGTAVWRAVSPDIPSTQGAIAGQEFRTARGQRSEFRLTDGSRVILGPDSRLVVAAGYGARARDVRLEGQGYFDVVHDERRPFAVHAGGTVARDLGTKFDVRAYAADSGVRVAVAEGKVELAARVLSPGDVGTRAADGRLTVRSGVDLDRYLAWTEGRLVFDDTPLVEALPELGRWYNLSFELADSGLARLPLSGTLTDRPSAETLRLLAVSLGADVERRGDVVVIGRGRR